MIASLCADYDRNGIIDEQDLACLYQGRILRHWVNDDEDNGDLAYGLSDLPGARAGYCEFGGCNHDA